MGDSLPQGFAIFSPSQRRRFEKFHAAWRAIDLFREAEIVWTSLAVDRKSCATRTSHGVERRPGAEMLEINRPASDLPHKDGALYRCGLREPRAATRHIFQSTGIIGMADDFAV